MPGGSAHEHDEDPQVSIKGGEFLYEVRSFHGVEDSNCGLLDYDTKASDMHQRFGGTYSE
jgi:hypothetical protein